MNHTQALTALILSFAFVSQARTVDQLVPQNATLDQVSYDGRRTVRLIAAPTAEKGASYAVVRNARFQNGSIEVALAGAGAEGYPANLEITPKLGGSEKAAAGQKIYFDRAHGELPWPPQMEEIGKRLGYELLPGNAPITSAALSGSRLAYLRAPNKTFEPAEKQALIAHVKGGGSLLVVLDEEARQKLAVVGVNDIIEPFGMKLSGDTPRIINTGALAKAGEINRADRQVPFDGGREVLGGTAFAYQLNSEGQPAQPFAAYVKLDNGARVIVLGEGMASLFLGSPQGVRLIADADKPVWWGKDSAIFMEEVLSWLLAR